MHQSRFCPPPHASKREIKPGIRLDFAPEQGNLIYKLNIKLCTFQINVSLGIRPKILP